MGCHLYLYTTPDGTCPGAESTKSYFTSSMCSDETHTWPGCGASCHPAGPSVSVIGCSGGEQGCRSVAVTTTYPEAFTSAGIVCSNPGANGWCRGPASLEINSSEPIPGFNILTVEGTRNGAAFACSGSTCSVPLLEGQNNFTYWALSSWGDSSGMGTAGGSVDTQPPSINGSLSGIAGNNGWFVSTVEVSASAGDATSGVGSIVYSFDGAATTSYSAPFSVGDGTHSIVFTATDVAGNSSSQTVNVNVDLSLPVITIDPPSGTTGDNGWFVSNATVGASATDGGSGLALLEYSVDGGLSAAYAGPVTLGDGTHTIIFTATDQAGNSGIGSTVVNIDTLAPQLALDGPADFCPACGGTATIDYSVGDPGSGVAEWTLQADGATLAGGTSADGGTYVWDGSGLPGGAHTITLQARDLAGNITQTDLSVILTSPRPADAPYTGSTPVRRATATRTAQPSATPASPQGQTSNSGGPTVPAPTATRTSAVVAFVQPTPEPQPQNAPSSAPAAAAGSTSGVMFGAEAAAVIGAAMAVIAEASRRRKEEEARAAEESARFNAGQIALEEQRRREAALRAYEKKIQEENRKAFEARMHEAWIWNIDEATKAEFRRMAETEGYGAAIAAVDEWIVRVKLQIGELEATLKAQEEQRKQKEEEEKRRKAEEWLREYNAGIRQQILDAEKAKQEAAAAEAEKNKPWWEKAWDNITTGVNAIVQGALVLDEKIRTDPFGTAYFGSIAALNIMKDILISFGNSSPAAKSIVETGSRIILGITDAADTVFRPKPGTTPWQTIVASTKIALTCVVTGTLLYFSFLGLKTALQIAGGSTTTAELCISSNCIQNAEDALNSLNESINSDISWDDVAVIGRYIKGNPASYEQIGSGVGANIFNMDPNIYIQLSEAQQLAANQEFLDKIIANRWYVYLTTPPDLAREGTSFWNELQFLFNNGYTISPDGKWLIPPPLP
jgi:hypothetical protein